MEALGGAMTHATQSGVASFIGEDDEDVLDARALPAVVPAVEQPARTRPPYAHRPTIPSASPTR